MSDRDELDKRDTIRNAEAGLHETTGAGNTLRGLNTGAPGADDGPPSSGTGPVIVPGVREPAPVEPPPPEAAVLAKKSSVPRLLAKSVTVPPEWLPRKLELPAEGDEEHRADYAAPDEPPNRTEHRTFELQTVKVDPYADPRTAPTQRKLKPPPSLPPPSSQRSPQRVLLIPIALAVMTFVMIVIAAVAYRGKSTGEPHGPVTLPETPKTSVPATPTVEETPRVVSPIPTPVETTAAPESSAAPKKPNSKTPGRPSADPFGRAF